MRMNATTAILGFSGALVLGAGFLQAQEVATVDRNGNVYVVDAASHTVNRMDASTGTMATVAGTGAAGFDGDQRLATQTRLDSPAAVAVDADGNLFIADSGNNRVRRVDVMTGEITTVARLGSPSGVAIDSRTGRLFMSDSSNHRISTLGADGKLQTVAGTGRPGQTGDGGRAENATLRFPTALGFDTAGNLLITDSGNGRIRTVSRTGIITSAPVTGRIPRTPVTPQKGTINLMSPCTGEGWLVGTRQTIRWSHNLGAATRFTVSMSRNGGASWTRMGDVAAEGRSALSLDWQVTGPRASVIVAVVAQGPQQTKVQSAPVSIFFPAE